MSEDGVGKFRQKKNHGNKPYERRRSFFGRVSDTVKDILSPSWLLDAVSSLKPTSGSNQQPEMLNEEQNAPSTSRFSTQSMGFSSSSLPTSYGFSNFSNHQPMSAHQQISNYSMVNALGTKETGASFKQVPFPAISEEEKPLSFNLQLNRMSDQIDSAHLPLDNFVYQQFDSKAANRSRNMDTSEFATENMRDTEFDSYHEIPPPFKTPGPNFKVSLFTPIRNRSGDESLNSSFGETSRLSPYYPGKTVYGGASAHRKSRFKINTTPYQAAVPMKRSTARPTRTASGAVTSSTAKKILDSLEKMSSIVQDAKKIPSYSHGNQSFAFSASSYKSKHTPYKDLGPPISRVNTPTPASHAKMRHPPEKQVSYNKPPSEMPVISRSSSGKMKREKGSHYSSKHLDEESELEVPDLPTKFTLPVQGIKLNFGVPFLKTTTTAESDLPKSPTFTFSTPIEKSSISPSKKKNVPLVQDFKFSTPIRIDENKKTSAETTPTSTFSFNLSAKKAVQSSKTGSVMDVLKGTVSSNSRNVMKSATGIEQTSVLSSLKGNTDNINLFGSNEAAPLKTGSVMDILGSFKAPKESETLKKDMISSFNLPNKKSGSWECDTCLVINKITANKCIACTSTKPLKSLAEKFKPAKNIWECSTCLVNNKETDSKCVACQASKPGATRNVGVNLAEKFKPPSGSWECDTCMLNNKSDHNKCVACQTKKPNGSSGSSQSFKFPTQNSQKWECSTCMVFNEMNKDKCVACQSVKAVSKPVSDNSLMDKFKPSPGQWECPTCMVNNKSNVLKCVACETSNPSSEKSLSVTKCESKWECSTCMVFNEPSVSKCIACESPNLSKKPVSAAVIGFGDKFKPNTDSWDCDTCLVNNKAGTTKCVACSTPKTGSQATSGFTKPVSGFVFKPTNGKSVSSSSGFKLATTNISEASSSSVGFKFVPVSVDKTNGPGGFKIDAPSTQSTTLVSGFSLPNSKNENKKMDSSSVSGSKFEESSVKPLFTFNSVKPTEAKSKNSLEGGFKLSNSVDTKPVTVGSTFKFNDTNGSSKIESLNVKAVEPIGSKTSASGGFSFNSGSVGGFTFNSGNSDNPSVAAPNAKLFNDNNAMSAASVPSSLFTFGAPKDSSNTISTNPLLTNNTASTPASASTSSLYTFGTSKDNSIPVSTKPLGSGGFSSGNPLLSGGISETSKSAAASFSFNTSLPTSPSAQKRKASNEDTGSVPINKKLDSGFSFAGSTSFSAPSAGGFNFKAANSSTQSSNTGLSAFSQPGQTTPASVNSIFAFGKPATKVPATSNTGFEGFGVPAQSSLVFGATSTNTTTLPQHTSTTSGQAPVFGMSTQANSFAAATPAFGSAAPAFGSNSSLNFGKSTTSAPAVSAFGTAATPVFGQSTTPAFGQQATVPNFGAPSTSSTFAPSVPSFGVTAPSFGNSTPSSGFNFGSSTTPNANVSSGPSASNAGVFQFGTKQTQMQPANPQTPNSGYNFAASAAQQAGAVGFNFGAPSAPSAFNFGASSAPNFAFNATSNSTPAAAQSAPRKIKKAIRKNRK